MDEAKAVNLYDVLFLIQLTSTLFMLGLIVFVQVVHYPLFVQVGENEHYYHQHQRRTTWIVLPVMGAELLTAVALYFLHGGWVFGLGLFLLAVIWLSTGCLQVPCHQRLLAAYEASVVDRLVRTNWIRTFAWLARAIMLILIA